MYFFAGLDCLETEQKILTDNGCEFNRNEMCELDDVFNESS